MHMGLFDDLKNEENAVLFVAKEKRPKGLMKTVKRIHKSKRVNKILNLPFKDIWMENPFVIINTTQIEKVIVIDGSMNWLNMKQLLKYRKHLSHIDFDLYLINSINAESLIIQNIKKYIFSFPWSHVYSFDPVESEQYGFEYKGFCYYSKKQIEENLSIQQDVFFVGGLKGEREQFVYDTYKYMIENGVSCKYIVHNTRFTRGTEKVEGIEYLSNGWLPYERILQEVRQSKCIVEIMQKNQNGPSLRYFEAVCYNKKLLTTNQNIVMFPYYNSEYMHIISDVDDIDINWLKQDIPVEYNYQGDFSPSKLIE